MKAPVNPVPLFVVECYILFILHVVQWIGYLPPKEKMCVRFAPRGLKRKNRARPLFFLFSPLGANRMGKGRKTVVFRGGEQRVFERREPWVLESICRARLLWSARANACEIPWCTEE